MQADFSRVYNQTDFQGFAELRRQAQEDSPEAIDAVARQFEALFIQMMLKSMRDAMSLDESSEGDQVKFYREMFDQQIALELSRGRGIGLRESLLRDLAPAAESSVPSTELNMPSHRVPARHSRVAEGADADSTTVNIQPIAAHTHPQRERMTSSSPSIPSGMASPSRASTATSEVAPAWRPESPEAFIETLWPHAEAAGAALGIAPEVLLAQSALETGWGRHIIQQRQGVSSHNLFGIKAHAGWQGERAHVRTLEYVNGVPEQQRAAFRAYNNPAESFADYVEFLQRNPRYRHALAQAPDAEGYLRGLQAAGYATDPQYADKILSILNRGTLQQMAELKSGASVPTS